MKDVVAIVTTPEDRIAVVIFRMSHGFKISFETALWLAANKIEFKDGDLADKSCEAIVEDGTIGNLLTWWILKRSFRKSKNTIRYFESVGKLQEFLREQRTSVAA